MPEGLGSAHAIPATTLGDLPVSGPESLVALVSDVRRRGACAQDAHP
jgi:hypothetical protein